MKATEQYFPVVLFIMLYKIVTFFFAAMVLLLLLLFNLDIGTLGIKMDDLNGTLLYLN